MVRIPAATGELDDPWIPRKIPWAAHSGVPVKSYRQRSLVGYRVHRLTKNRHNVVINDNNS